jgi:hypothetical protein
MDTAFDNSFITLSIVTLHITLYTGVEPSLIKQNKEKKKVTVGRKKESHCGEH